MKKLLCVLLCMLLAVAVLAGCTTPNISNTDDPDATEATLSQDPNDGVHFDENGELYVPRHDGVTLKIGIPLSAHVIDYVDNAYTQWLEEKTGITLEFQTYSSSTADYKKQMATDTASGTVTLPDILLNFNLGEDLIQVYGEDEYLMDLTPYLENKVESAIFWDRMDGMRNDTYSDYDAFADRIWMLMHSNSRSEDEAEESPIYGLPRVITSLTDTMDFIPYINTNWLKAVNKEMPTNWDQLVDVLRAFKNGDPNGNNDTNDEIPMIGAKNDQLSGDIVAWLLNFWVYSNNDHWFNVDDNGKIYLPHTTNDYRKGMEAISALVSEGLLHPKSLSYENKSLNNLLNNGDYVGVLVGQPTLVFNGNMDIINRFEPLNLYGNAYYKEETLSIRNFITTDCTNVDAAWDLMMLMYTKEAAIRQRWGEEGVNWEWSNEGVMSPMGMPATINILKEEWSTPTSAHWNIVLSIATYDCHDLIEVDTTNAWNAAKWDIFSKSAANYKAAVEKTLTTVGEENICPWLRFNEDEDDMSKDRDSLKKEINAWMSKFILGEKNAKSDADWAEYLAAMDRAGIQKYIDAAQLCYDRMYPNGHVSK